MAGTTLPTHTNVVKKTEIKALYTWILRIVAGELQIRRRSESRIQNSGGRRHAQKRGTHPHRPSADAIVLKTIIFSDICSAKLNRRLTAYSNTTWKPVYYGYDETIFYNTGYPDWRQPQCTGDYGHPFRPCNGGSSGSSTPKQHPHNRTPPRRRCPGPA